MSSIRRRMVVTGCEGQVVRSLLECGHANDRFEIVALGRPSLDLREPESIDAVLRQTLPDIIVSAAAYTAVDQAETDETTATVVNGIAPGKIAAVADSIGIPVIHISTDYVFDGSKSQPYLEGDQVAPTGAYGRSKLAGERYVTSATDNHAILRTAWVYSPFGRNFLKAMLRAAQVRDTLTVVDDQIGNPTSALDIADGILRIAFNLLESNDAGLRGTFHMAGSGEASWAAFATEIFSLSAYHGGPSARVVRIPSQAYPTPTKRPANSRLDCTKLEKVHGVTLGDWRQSTARVIERVLKNEPNNIV